MPTLFLPSVSTDTQAYIHVYSFFRDSPAHIYHAPRITSTPVLGRVRKWCLERRMRDGRT